MNIQNLTIDTIHEGLINKEFSCTELTKAFLEKAKKENERLNIYITITEKEALETAAHVDEKIARGESISGLEGIPCSIKDLINTKGIRSTSGSAILSDFVSPYDATVVQKLRDAGMIMIGKTNLDEFACGGSTEYSFVGPTRNPHNERYTAGGSSGGSAAAVAAGTCLYALGTDTGGSIRQPASFCGVPALKVTYGRVSRSGVTAMASSLDTVGPFAHSCRDIAHVMNTIAGSDPEDSTTPEVVVPNYLHSLDESIKGLTIGIPKEYFDDGIDEEVKESVHNAIKQLEKQGATVKEVSLPMTKYAIAVYYIVMPAELSANLARFDAIRFGTKPDHTGESLEEYYLNARGEGFGDEVKRRIMMGTYVLSAGYYDAYYKKAQKVRTAIIEEFNTVFQEVDVLIGPTVPTPAFKLGEKLDDPLQMYLVDSLTVPMNIAGLPALNVPCGSTKKGLPIGMQIIGPQFSEAQLLTIGHTYETHS
ncbi:Asp-tRNA(Asn)/Glu-tRNA(Gln) amidotransferase subunit GatA [Candidatus Peregrinibacteria bacterium]|nr:Asp-tRNA(Asn)/Glu-tRNA(Gln) amidotransferase subunit GatA [Candidatus Peregrinibacteria bacterium]